MCQVCYQEYGSPRVVIPKTVEAARLVNEVYCYSVVGGNLHVVVDDWNLDDYNLQYCIQQAKEDPDTEKAEAELACAELLLTMSIEERASAMALHEGWLS